MLLVTYDVSTVSPKGAKRLRKVAKVCVNYGQRVQNSVFECLVDPAKYIELKHSLERIIDKEEDSLRFYHLGSNWDHKVETLGKNVTYHPEKDTLLF